MTGWGLPYSKMTGHTITDKIGSVGSVTALSPAEVAAARVTLAELALDTSDDPHADLALALAVLGLGGRERGLWLEQP